MKAIDFATHLLRRLDESELSGAEQRVMLAIARGSSLCRDLAQHTGLNSYCCKTALQRLEKIDFIRRVKGKKYSQYFLSQLGEIHIRTLLSFIPFQHE